MDTKNIKDEQIRKQIITASEVYRDKLAIFFASGAAGQRRSGD